MKKLLALIFFASIFSSCMNTIYYQVYKVDSKDIPSKEDAYVFENDDCSIAYNFFENNGTCGFQFFNKTDENIYIDMTESHFIKNGMAHDYYKGRTFNYSKNTQVGKKQGQTYTSILLGGNVAIGITGSGSGAVSESMGSSTSYEEQKVICIPPRSAKFISEYAITDGIYKECNYLLYPNRTQARTLSFSQENSPIVFANRIAYSVGIEMNKVVENNFYIKEIINLPEKEATTTIKVEKCVGFNERVFGSKEKSVNAFKRQGPDTFYIKYNKQ